MKLESFDLSQALGALKPNSPPPPGVQAMASNSSAAQQASKTTDDYIRRVLVERCMSLEIALAQMASELKNLKANVKADEK